MTTVSQTMQRLMYVAPRTVRLERAAAPAAGPGQLLLRVERAGICGSEVETYLGLSPTRKPPLLLGHEFCGRVVDASRCRQTWRADELVAVYPLLPCFDCRYCRGGNHQVCPQRQVLSMHLPGAFAEYITVDERIAFRVPEHVSGLLAALAEPLGTAVHAIKLGAAAAGPDAGSLVVIGCGTIGLLTIAYAKHQGFERIVAIDLHPMRLDHARRAGADAAIDSRDRTGEDIAAAVTESLGGGADLVVEAAGVPTTRQLALASTAPLGTIVWLGLHAVESSINFTHLIRNQITCLGSYSSRIEDFQTAIASLADGVVRDVDWIQVQPLSEGPQAFDELVNHPDQLVKVVLDPTVE